MKTTILERIYQRLLAENGKPDTTSYAAVVRNIGKRKTAVVYRAADLETAITQNPEVAFEDFVVGYVMIKSTDDPCWEAYQIANIIGPGKIMYGIAYAMSPKGRLISDRTSMTLDAKKAWFKMSQKKSRNTLKLDNVRTPSTPDAQDDCRVYKDKRFEFLNYAYESEGWETGMLADLQNSHKRILQILKSTNVGIGDFENRMLNAGSAQFGKAYREAEGIPLGAPKRARRTATPGSERNTPTHRITVT